jgi:hypothetical protein
METRLTVRCVNFILVMGLFSLMLCDTSTAIAHSSTENDEYRGYFIPKGSIVIGNSWIAIKLGLAKYVVCIIFPGSSFTTKRLIQSLCHFGLNGSSNQTEM